MEPDPSAGEHAASMRERGKEPAPAGMSVFARSFPRHHRRERHPVEEGTQRRRLVDRVQIQRSGETMQAVGRDGVV
jgi:hypothetical protein